MCFQTVCHHINKKMHVSTEHRYMVKFCVKLKKSKVETIAPSKEAFQNETLHDLTICRCAPIHWLSVHQNEPKLSMRRSCLYCILMFDLPEENALLFLGKVRANHDVLSQIQRAMCSSVFPALDITFFFNMQILHAYLNAYLTEVHMHIFISHLPTLSLYFSNLPVCLTPLHLRTSYSIPFFSSPSYLVSFMHHQLFSCMV